MNVCNKMSQLKLLYPQNYNEFRIKSTIFEHLIKRFCYVNICKSRNAEHVEIEIKSSCVFLSLDFIRKVMVSGDFRNASKSFTAELIGIGM